jgi:hypothetical protein
MSCRVEIALFIGRLKGGAEAGPANIILALDPRVTLRGNKTPEYGRHFHAWRK